MEVLYKLLYRKRFWTAYHHISFNFKRQEIALFKLFLYKREAGTVCEIGRLRSRNRDLRELREFTQHAGVHYLVKF